MLARRLLIALAVLMGLTALAAGVAPREPPVSDDGRPEPTVDMRPGPAPVEETLDAQASDQRVVAQVGQTVTIIVRSRELDSVSLAEVGIETAEPDSPARFALLAEIPGTYPIELLQAERRIGTLEIRD